MIEPLKKRKVEVYKAAAALRRAAFKFVNCELCDDDLDDKRGKRLNRELLKAARRYAAVFKESR